MENLENGTADEVVTETTNAADTAAETTASAETTTETTAETTATEAASTEDDDKAKSAWGDDWRDQMAGGDEDVAKIIKRYGSPRGVAKALKDAQEMIRSGKLKRDAPDPNDDKAMAEWRKEQGIPDDPTGYKLPDPVSKRLTDEDKPVLAAFTEFAHGKNAPQSVIDIATEWYVENAEKAATVQSEQDRAAEEEAEDALRKDWSHAEFKTNMSLASRFIADAPGIGENWAEYRGPDGRRLGDNPQFIAWAADMGRQQFGDVAFATPDGERRHTARREEIEKIRDTDFDRYEAEGLDKELRKLIEKDLQRGKK